MAHIKNSWSASSGARADTIVVTVSGVTENNLVLASIALDSADTLNSSNGFTQIATIANGSATAVSLWGKVAGASEPTTYTWTTVGGAKTELGAGVFEFVGAKVDGATMADNVATVTSTATAATYDPTDISSGMVEGDFGMVVAGLDGQFTMTTPASGHSAWASNPVYGDNDCTLLVQFKDLYTTGTTYAPGSTTISGTTEVAMIAVGVHRGPGVLFSTEPLTLSPKTFNIYTGLVVTSDTYRFRKDDGSETAATWQALADTDAEMPIDDILRLRYGLNNIVPASDSVTVNLQYRKNNGSAWSGLSGETSNYYGGTNYYFGREIDVTNDGSRIVISAPDETTNGRVYVQRATGNAFYDTYNWWINGTSSTDDPGDDGITISDDGNLFVFTNATDIITWDITGNGPYTNWTQLDTMARPGLVYALELSGNGERLFVATSGNSVYWYDWNSGTTSWDLVDFIKPTTSTTTLRSVTSNTTGSKIVTTGTTGTGAYGKIHTWEPSGATYIRVVTGVIPFPVGEVAMAGKCDMLSDGSKLVVADCSYASSAGGVVVYEWDDTNTTWILSTPMKQAGQASSDYGCSPSIYYKSGTADTLMVAVGAPNNEPAQYSNEGAVFHYTITESWVAVGAQGTGTAAIIYANSTHLTDGEATTQQISDGTFYAGKAAESSNTVISYTGAGDSEIEFVLKAPTLNDSNEEGDVFVFRLTGITTDGVSPQLTLGGAPLSITIFNAATLSLDYLAFNRTVPAIVTYQGYKDDGGVGVRSAKAFSNSPWIQADDEIFHVSLLVHFSGVDAVEHALRWVYSIDGGTTWNVIGYTTVDAVETVLSSYLTNNASFTNILTSPVCGGQLLGKEMENDNYDVITGTADYCKEYTNSIKINSAYLDPSNTLMISMDEETYGVVSHVNPALMTRVTIVPMNTGTMDMAFTQPAITNLPVIMSTGALTLAGQPFRSSLEFEVQGFEILQWTGGSYYNTHMSCSEAHGRVSGGIGLKFLCYTAGVPDGATQHSFKIQERTDGGTWTDISTHTGVYTYSGVKIYSKAGTSGYEDDLSVNFAARAVDDGVTETPTNTTYHAYSGSSFILYPDENYGLQAGAGHIDGLVFGDNTPDGTVFEFRVWNIAGAYEVAGAEPYPQVTIKTSLGSYDVEWYGVRHESSKYHPMVLEGEVFHQGEVVMSEQTHNRYRYDNGSETTATWIKAVNTDASISRLQPFRVRLGIDTVVYPQNEEVSADHLYKLQYQKLAGLFSDATVIKEGGEIPGYPYGMSVGTDRFVACYGDGVVSTYNTNSLGQEAADFNISNTIGNAAISHDGTVLCVWDTITDKVYTYDFTAGAWAIRTYELPLYATLSPSDIGLNEDGSILVAGYPEYNSWAGRVVVYTWNGGTTQWDVTQTLDRHETTIGNFGGTVAIAGDTDQTIVVGNSAHNSTVHMEVWKKSGTWAWSETLNLNDYIPGTSAWNGATLDIAEDALSLSTCVLDGSSARHTYILHISTETYEWAGATVQPDFFGTGGVLGQGISKNGVFVAFNNHNSTGYRRFWQWGGSLGDWTDVPAQGATTDGVRLYNSPEVVDGTATTQQITSGTYVAGEIVEVGIPTVTFNASGVTELEYAVESYSGETVAGDAFRFRAYFTDLKPVASVTNYITMDQTAIQFSTATLTLNGSEGMIVPVLFNIASVLTLNGLGMEAGYAQYELFNTKALVLDPKIYEANHGIIFELATLSLSTDRITTDPTTAIINQRDFRVRADDNYENLASWQANLNASWGQSYTEQFRVRFVLENSTLSAPNQTQNYKSQYNLNNEGTFSIAGSPIERTVADTADSNFGQDVAISGDGTVMAIGASYYDGTYTNQGRVYIYDRVGDSWVYRSYIEAPTPAANMYFGQGLALSFTGNQIFVGEPYATVTYTGEGRVHVYIDAGSDFVFSETITTGTTLSTDAHFGWAISTNQAGDRLFIGVPNYDWTVPTPDQLDAGAFEIFYKISGVWTWQEGLTLQIGGAHFGTAIASSDDGMHLAIGCPDYNDPGIIVFWDDVDGTWTIRANAIGGSNSGEQFGSSISANKTGRTLLIGAPNFSGAEGQQGRAYIIDWDGDITSPTYTNRQSINNPNGGPSDKFGSGVAMSSTGDWCYIGCPGYDNTYNNQGAVYKLEPTYIWTTITTTTPIQLTNSAWITDGEATTQQLSSGHFDAGTVDEADYTTTTWTTEGVSEVEYVYALDSAQVIQSDLIKVRLEETTNNTVPSQRDNTPVLEVFSGELDRGILHLTTSSTMSTVGTVLKTATMDITSTSIMYGNGTNEKEATMHITSDSVMTTAGSFVISGSLTVATTSVFYGISITTIEGAMHLSSTSIMNAIAFDGSINGQLTINTTSTWTGAGNINRNASMALLSTSTIALPSSVIHRANMALATTTTASITGNTFLAASMTVTSTSIMTTTGSVLLGPAICRMRSHSYMSAALTYVPFHYGKARWNVTTKFVAQPRAIFGGKATLVSTSTMSAFGRRETYGNLDVTSTSIFTADGHFIRSGSLSLESQSTLTSAGRLIIPAGATWYTNSTLYGKGGLTFAAKCVIIGASTIDIEASMVRNAFVSYVSDSGFLAIPTVDRTSNAGMASSATMSMSGSVIRGARATLAVHSYWSASGEVIKACIRNQSNIVSGTNSTSVSEATNQTNTICGESI